MFKILFNEADGLGYLLNNPAKAVKNLAHNHPSGNMEPSREDREATQRLVKAGTLLGIEVLDHLIITKSGFYSFKESGDMPSNISLS